jgi:mannose-1-phosphate guanylyltransferase
MAVLTADHYITGTEQFRRVLETACSATKDGHLVPLGIKPASPPTGFGCIQQGECLDLVNDFPIFRVERFTEKPALDAARQMMTSGEYSWNSGMFVWRVDRILEEIQIRMPDLYARLMEVEAALGRADYRTILLRAWNKVAEQTIDFGVMEHAEDVAVIPVDIGWTDVENWASLAELFSPDEYLCRSSQ